MGDYSNKNLISKIIFIIIKIYLGMDTVTTHLFVGTLHQSSLKHQHGQAFYFRPVLILVGVEPDGTIALVLCL
jgi:hypothetical protein